VSRAQRILWTLAAPAAAVVIALTVTSVVLLLTGNDPIDTYRTMWSSTTNRASIAKIINRAIPLYISALAAAVAFRMNLFNIGVDGQYRIAALMAAVVGAAVSLPPVLHVPLILLVAMSAGAFWAGIAGALKVTRNVNVVISTIMLNSIATGVGAYLLTEHFREVSDQTNTTRTPEIPESGRIPALNRLLNWFGLDFDPQFEVVFGAVVLAALVGIAVHVMLFRTRFGFELRASGVNPSASRAAGVATRSMEMKAMLISGGIAGLVGIPQLLGEFHEFRDTFPSALGFNGIGVALLGRNNPIGIVFGALLWAFLEQSTAALALQGITPEISFIMKGTVLLSVVIAYEVVARRQEAAQTAAVSSHTVVDSRVPAGATA
jgi:simple sugar transport system permease protein